MAKKEIMRINYSVSACKGIFDKNENGEYIITVDGTEYLFEDYSQYFLGGTIELHSSEGE